MSVRAIGDLERGRVRRPRPASVALLVGALGLTDAERGAVAEAVRVVQSAAVVVRPGGLVVDAGGAGGAAVRAGPGDVVGGVNGGAAAAAPGVAASGWVAAGVAAPAQLPAAVAALTGRGGQLGELDAVLLGDGDRPGAAVAVVTGSAGVGKTALAVCWAHRVRGRFPGGQLFADLRGDGGAEPVRPVEVLAAFLHALGVPGEGVPAGVEEAAGLFRTLLAGRRVLVVLDNAHSPGQVRPLLPGSAGCRVVVTSRDRLAGLVAREGAHHVGLEVLTPGAARVLLARTVGQERVAAEPGAAAELARLCAGLPLALRIAAAQLTGHPQPIAEYVAELAAGDRLSALEAGGDEQAAVRAAFDASYHGLPAAARRLFRLLGLVPGVDLTRDAAAVLAGVTAAEASALLGRLVSGHLLSRAAGGRYGCHDLLRLYAAERCEREDSAPERAAATRRLQEWYLHAADTAARVLYPERLRLPLPPLTTRPAAPVFAGRAEAMAWLDAERATLVTVTRHAATAGPRHRVGWLLANTLRGYFWRRMHLIDWLATAQTGLAAAEADGDLRAQAAALLSLGDAYSHHGEHDNATQRYTAALALMRQTGWLQGQTAVLNNLGVLHRRAGRLRESQDHHAQALAIHRQSGSIPGEATSLINLGKVCYKSGQLEQAIEYEAQALSLSREAGFGLGEGVASTGLGEFRHAQGRLDEAVSLLTRALDLLRETGNRSMEGEALRLLAGAHADAGRPVQALELAHAALALARDLADRRREADALNTVAACNRRLGHDTEAANLHRQALHLACRAATRYPEAVALIGLAIAGQQAGDTRAALDHAHDALALTRDTGYRCLEGQALATLAGLHLGRGQPGKAAEYARQALAVHRETGQRLHQAHTHVLAGHAQRRTQGAAAARPEWQEALTLLTEAGSPQADHVRGLLQQPADFDPMTTDLPMT
jgi:tetratricopeptide (TPR) repeat protein